MENDSASFLKKMTTKEGQITPEITDQCAGNTDDIQLSENEQQFLAATKELNHAMEILNKHGLVYHGYDLLEQYIGKLAVKLLINKAR
jgi:hypothetical protein